MTNARVMQVATSLNSALANYHIGMIIAFAGSTAPNGWFICDGREVSRAEYSRLFALIGVAYGNGNGTTTFNIPNLQDRFLQGASATNVIGTSKEAGLPNIKGSTMGGNSYNLEASIFILGWDGALGCPNRTTSENCYRAGSENIGYGSKLYLDASKSNSIYSDDCNTVQPPSVCINYIIKY